MKTYKKYFAIMLVGALMLAMCLPAMAAVRAAADSLERITDKTYWPFPTYDDLLFSVQ